MQFITYFYFTASVVRRFIWKAWRYTYIFVLPKLTCKIISLSWSFIIVQKFYSRNFYVSNTLLKGSSHGSRLDIFLFHLCICYHHWRNTSVQGKFSLVFSLSPEWTFYWIVYLHWRKALLLKKLFYKSPE